MAMVDEWADDLAKKLTFDFTQQSRRHVHRKMSASSSSHVSALSPSDIPPSPPRTPPQFLRFSESRSDVPSVEGEEEMTRYVPKVALATPPDSPATRKQGWLAKRFGGWHAKDQGQPVPDAPVDGDWIGHLQLPSPDLNMPPSGEEEVRMPRLRHKPKIKSLSDAARMDAAGDRKHFNSHWEQSEASMREHLAKEEERGLRKRLARRSAPHVPMSARLQQPPVETTPSPTLSEPHHFVTDLRHTKPHKEVPARHDIVQVSKMHNGMIAVIYDDFKEEDHYEHLPSPTSHHTISPAAAARQAATYKHHSSPPREIQMQQQTYKSTPPKSKPVSVIHPQRTALQTAAIQSHISRQSNHKDSHQSHQHQPVKSSASSSSAVSAASIAARAAAAAAVANHPTY